MRIVLVADEDPGWGGIGTYTGVLGQALHKSGHEVNLVLRGWEGERVERLDGLTVHRVPVPDPRWRRGTVAAVSRLYLTRESLMFSRRVAGLLRRLEPDVVEAPEFHAAALFAALGARLRRNRPAVCVRLHAPTFLTTRLSAERADADLRVGEGLEAMSAHAARLVTAPSRALADLVARRWRLPAGRVSVIPNPIDESVFTPGGRPAQIPGRILVVGRIERAKGQDLLVEALPQIRRSVPDAHLLAVGADGGALDALKRRAGDLGIANAVGFAGACERSKLPEIYRSASVCVVPSRFEAFPYTALEAMACARPVVAARVGGLAEVFDDPGAGRLVAPEDPAALAGAISALLADRAERERLGAAGRARVLTRYASSQVAARMAEAYAEVAR